MEYGWRGFIGRALRCGLVASALLVISSCGGSDPAGPAPVIGPVAVLPATATVYSDTPTTFLVSGGSGSFVLVSSDQAVVPVTNTFSGGSFTVVPGAVAVETPVTLTVRDANGSTQAAAQLTVKPRTVSGTVSITPSAGQSAACGTAVCAGGDAEVVATFAQGGVPLLGREARFEVVSGDFRIITSSSGTAETLATSAVTTTDSTGQARMRIRALSTALSQTALIQITDVSSGSFTRTGFAITPASSGPLSAQPNSITFRGRDSTACANGISAEIFVVGGRPPYTVSLPAGFNVSPTTINASGGRFVVTAMGQCATAQIAVVDSIGATSTVSVTNALGSDTSNTAALTVGPTALTLDSKCSSIASAIVANGLGSYFALSGSEYLTASVGGNVVSIRRAVTTAPTPAPPTTSIPVAVSDGRAVITITVTVPSTPCVP